MANITMLCNNCQYSFLPKDSTPLFPIIDDLKDIFRFRSNQPSCTDTQQARSYIEAERHELAKYEEEIIRVHGILAMLVTHRAALVERIERCQSWFSPIRRLPVEILEKIFALVCTRKQGGRYALEFNMDVPMYRWSISAPILALTHVSHLWRAVSNASPSLWSFIYVDLRYEHFERHQMVRLESLLVLCLTNSRDHPLYLTYLHPCIRRCKPSMLKVLTPHIPRIERLDLVHDDPHAVDVDDRLPQWFEDSPCMAKLSNMKMEPFLSQLATNKIPWHQLRVLEIIRVENFQHLGPVLKLCTNLHSLMLRLWYSSRPAPDDSDLIEIKSVRRLAVTVGGGSRNLSLLQPLVLPSLSSFTIGSLTRTYGTLGLRLEPAIDLIRRSKCHLDEFAMKIRDGSLDIPRADLYDFLTLCPELSQLEFDVPHLHGCEVADPGTLVCQLLDVLSLTDSHEQPIPSPPLTHLIISERWSDLNSESVDALLGRLEARIGVLRDYRARVPIPRWKWDLRFGALPDGLEELRSRMEKLASGLKLQVGRCEAYH